MSKLSILKCGTFLNEIILTEFFEESDDFRPKTEESLSDCNLPKMENMVNTKTIKLLNNSITIFHYDISKTARNKTTTPA